MMRVQFGVVLILLAFTSQRGLGLLDVAVPESGTIISEFANDSLQLELFCRILVPDGTQQAVTFWFLLNAQGKALGRSPGSIEQNDDRFSFSGNTIMASGFNIPTSTNLTINSVTTDLHNSTISCGNSMENSLGVFTIFIYVNPSVPVNLQIMFIEDTVVTITWQTPSNLGNPLVAYYALIITDDDQNLTFINEHIPAIDNDTVFTVSGLMPVTQYSIELTAVSQLTPVLVASPSVSLNFTTDTTVPLVDCETVTIAKDRTSVTVEWTNVHTGGLNLTSASIEYTISSGGRLGNFTPVEDPQIDIDTGIAILRALPEAGINYVFRVTTENDEGKSLPSMCRPVFLAIGTPSTPEVPSATADGPVALLRLRTANSGNGGAILPFAFTLLIYQLNSSGPQLVSTKGVFNSSQYISNDTVVVHIEDVMELNRFYSFAVKAINMFGTSEISPLSSPILLNVSVPSIIGLQTQQGSDGVTVMWTFRHTGRSEITLIEILLREDRVGTTFELVPGGNISRPDNDTFDIVGSSLQAGVSYVVGVRASNGLGVSELSVSRIPDLIIGIPMVPSVPTLYSSTTSSVTLILSITSTGLVTPDDSLTFHLRIIATDIAGSDTTTTFQTGNFSMDMLRESVRMTVDVVIGTNYVFSVRAENRFGISEYSGNSERISITQRIDSEDDERDVGLEMREVIGIAVGGGIVVLLLLACCLIVLCAICTRGSGKKADDNEDDNDIAMEMIDNNTYQGYKQNSLKIKEKKDFSSEEMETLYEPPPNDNATGVPLRPKPTHPTSTKPTDMIPPLYDSLEQSRGRQMSTYSSASNRELPNPLYSGTTRPSSLHDSGSGTISSRGRGGGGGGVTIGGGVGGEGGEPLYSEASVPPKTSDDAVYTEPDSRSSKLLESISGPPPPPPDPRTIPTSSPPTGNDPLISSADKDAPTYAEAGPAESQDHLYSELPDPTNRHTNPSPSFPHPFHVPPPPPPTQPPPSSSTSPLPTSEPSYSVPSRSPPQ